jgi:thiol-disulfide isomerase/thioredoxin
MPNNNKKSNSSNSSMSFSSVSKTDWQMLAFIALIVMVFAVYYVSYKNNREPFEGGSDDDEPNLNVNKGEKVVALFYADWCPHCVSFKPHYKKAMSSLGGKKHKGKTLRFVMVDCDKNKTISKKYDVSGFPTVKILNDDKSTDEYSGERSLEGLTGYFS